MAGLETWQDTIANNISNSNSAGYKSVNVALHGESMPLASNGTSFDSQLGVEMVRADSRASMSKGLYVQSDDAMDCAIDGGGFFQVKYPDGSTHLTRNGRFHLNSDNQLATADGGVVQGESGAITLVSGAGELAVSPDGTVQQGTTQVGKLAVYSVTDPEALSPVGGGFIAKDGAGVEKMEDGHILQGYYEASNVSPMREMVSMIELSRAYEANSKSIQAQDSMMGSAISAFSA